MTFFGMVVCLALIVTVGIVLNTLFSRGAIRQRGEDPATAAEIRALKERVAVLETLATDGSTRLDREIERLRVGPPVH